MVALDDFPTAKAALNKVKSTSFLGNRRNFLRKDFLKKVEHALMVEKLIWLVVVKIRLAQILQILVVVVVQFDDFFNERLVAGKVGPVQEAADKGGLIDP